MAKKLKKQAAEELEEIKEVEETSKPEEKEEKVEEVKEETSEEAPVEEAEESKEDVITLDSGAVVDESAQPTVDEAEDLVKITKEDGSELFVEKVEGDTLEEKKEVYEAIVEADTEDSAEEASEEVLEALNDSEEVSEIPAEEEIEAVSYVPAACHSVQASLENSFVIFKLKSGKIKALKAGKIYNQKLKAALLNKIEAGKEEQIPHISVIIKKIASKIGSTFTSFKKYASLNTKAMAKQAAEADSSTEKAVLENTSLAQQDLKKNDFSTGVAIEEKDVIAEEKPAEVKPAKSKVKEFYGRLPNKSNVGEEVEWYLKDFNEKRNKTVASQIKSLRASVEMVKQLKEKNASLEAENKALQEKLNKIEASQKHALKFNKIAKINNAMNLKDELVKRTMQTKLASYDEGQLDAVLACYSMDPEIETTLMNERNIEQMRKEASVEFVPPVMLGEDEVSFNNEIDYVSLLKKEEIEKVNK